MEKVRLVLTCSFSLDHRWCGGQNVRLRVWGNEEEGGEVGVLGMSARVCM